MTETLKEMFIALGIFFGILSPQTDPLLNIRIYRTEEQVYYSLEVKNCLNADSAALIEASSTLRVQIEIFRGREKEPFLIVFHTIAADLVSGIYTVYYSSTDSYHRTEKREAAYQIFRSFYNLPLTASREFEQMTLKSFRFRASISLENQEEFDAGVLWNYKEPEKKFNYKSLKEIPY